MILPAVDVELARQQWEEGSRRVERARGDPPAYARLTAQVELVLAELRGRVGQRFTLAELAVAYDDAVEWARRAGIQHATSATRARLAALVASATGSAADTP